MSPRAGRHAFVASGNPALRPNRDPHAHERIVVCVLMDEALPVGQLLADQRLTHGRCVNNLARSRVGELGSGDTADFHRLPFNCGANGNCG